MRILITGNLGFIGSHLGFKVGPHLGLDLQSGQDVRSCDLPDADLVYHLAAQTDAQSEDWHLNMSTNIHATIRLALKYRSRLILASSSMVNYTENLYGYTKKCAELICLSLDARVVRLPNVYGDGGHSVFEKFGEAEVLEIRGTGGQLRTYAPVEHAVAALLDAGSPDWGQMTIVKGEDLSVLQVADRFPWKERTFVPSLLTDLMDARQI